MILAKDRQRFSGAVGIIIAIQGVAWFGLSITGIVVKKSEPSIAEKGYPDLTYTQFIARIIYDNFLTNNSPRDKVIRPQDFEAFLWIYAVLSGLWVAAALDLNLAIRFKNNRQSHSALLLGVVVLLTSVIDLVLFSLLARDYSTCPFELSTATDAPTTTITTPTQNQDDNVVESLIVLSAASTATPLDCKLASGVVMSIAARGYVLWLINIVTAVCLISIGITILRNPRILSYEKNTIPRVKFPEQQKRAGLANSDFLFYGDNEGFNSTTALNAPRPRSNNSNTPVVLSNKNQNSYF